MPPRLHRSLLILWTGLLLGLTVWSGWLGASWIDKPFNGFLVQPMLYVSPYQHDRWQVPRSGIEPVDVVLAVEGRPVRDTPALVAEARAVPVGTPLSYTVMRGQERLELRVPTQLFTRDDFVRVFGFHTLLGWSFLLMALTLFWLRPGLAAARAFAIFSTSMGLLLTLYFDFHTTVRLVPLSITAYALVGPGFLGLALYFPRRSRWLDRFPRLPIMVAAFGAGLVLAYHALVLTQGPAMVEPARYQLGFSTVLASNIVLVLGLSAAIAAVVIGFFAEPRRSLGRRQAAIALVGAGLGLVPTLAWAAPMTFGVNSPVPLSLALVFLMLFPISVAVAIVRAQLFEITVVVRQSLLYLLLSGLLLLAHVGAAAATRSLLPGQSPADDMVATALVVALFVPMRDRLQAWLDRRLFRASYDAQVALEQASRSMTALLDRDQIVERMRQTLGTTLHPVFEQVYLRDEAGEFMAWVDRTDPPLSGDHPLVLALAAGRAAMVRAPDNELSFVGLGPVEVAVPLMFEQRLQGVLLLCHKRSEASYTRQDLRLLMTLANQSAIALENASAYARLRAFNEALEARVAERTRELEQAQARLVQTEKMSALGQLVAGVAHELNNPVTFLVSGVELLEERLADQARLREAEAAGLGPEALAALKEELGAEALPGEIENLLASCKEGAARTRAIVQGLREFSRLDGFSREALALGPCIETTVPMVAASFRDRVRLHVEVEEAPLVLGSAIHLKQVVLNMLVNACQAIEGEGEVWVSLRPRGPEVELTVRDTGRGIGEEARPHLFEPFFTTKPPGEGTGLGLAICHGIIEAHGGRIEVESVPGEGSAFRVLLPGLAPPREEEYAHAADRG